MASSIKIKKLKKSIVKKIIKKSNCKENSINKKRIKDF